MNSLLAGVAPADVHNRDPHPIPLITSGATILGDGVLAENGNVVFCQLPPNMLSDDGNFPEQLNLRRTYRRTSVMLARLLANLGVRAGTPLLSRFHQPVSRNEAKGRWLQGLYLDQPEEWDDPYRFFRW